MHAHDSVHTPPYSPANAHAHMNSPRNLHQHHHQHALTHAHVVPPHTRVSDPHPRARARADAGMRPDYKRMNSFEFERVAPYLHAHRHHSPTHRELAEAHAHHLELAQAHHEARAHRAAAAAAYAQHHAAAAELAHSRDLPSLSPPPNRDFELVSDDGLRSTPPPTSHPVHSPTHASAAAALHAISHAQAQATTPPIVRGGYRPARSPPAVGDGPIDRLGDELLTASAAVRRTHGHAHHRAASAAAAVGVPPPAAPGVKRSVFDEPAPASAVVHGASQHLEDNYLRPKSSSVDTALPPLDEFSAMRITELDHCRLSHLRAPAQHPAKSRVQHQRAQSHGIMGTQGLRLRETARNDQTSRASEAPARVTSEDSNDSPSDGRPPLPPSSGKGADAGACAGAAGAASANGPGGLVPYKRRKRGRRPSAQAQREKRETKRSVYLSPLPAGASFETVRDLLKDFGGLQTVEFIEDGKSCYARFESYPQADRAVEAGTVGDGVVVMPKKLRVEEVKELQESLAELDAQKKLLQERLGPLAAGGALSASADTNGGGVSSTSGAARANALRESGRGHQRHSSTPTGSRFGGSSNHHRFSSNPPTGVQALSAGKALRHNKGGGGSNSRKSSVHGSGGRRGDRSGSNSRRSSASGGGNGTNSNDRPSKYGTNSRRSSLTSEQLEGSWRGGGGGGGSIHRRAYSDMNPLNAPQRGGGSSGISRFGGHGHSHSNSLAAPSANAYQPPQKQQHNKSQAPQVSNKKFPNAQASSATAAAHAAESKSGVTTDATAASGKPSATSNGVSVITVTAPQRSRGDSANSATLSPPGPGSRVLVNGPSTAHGAGLAAVSVASRPGSRRGSLATVATTFAKGPDGSKGFNWKQTTNAAK